VKICLDWHAKIALVILLFGLIYFDRQQAKGRGIIKGGDTLKQDLQHCEF